MGFLEMLVLSVGCIFLQQPFGACVDANAVSTETVSPAVAGAHVREPALTGNAIDVILSADAALVWDVNTGKILYEKEVDKKRPIASLNKLLVVLSMRDVLEMNQVVEIPSAIRKAQRSGANIKLPVGEHMSVEELIEASLVASANDAAVSLALSGYESEEEFAEYASAYAQSHGFENTKLANATGFSGGEQFSTARDVMRMLAVSYDDPVLRPYLSEKKGTVRTVEGTRRSFTSTNKLLGTYMPILAAKTGYTREAGENLVVITEGENGEQIGAVILESENRFHDMKVLVEWIWRNYTWE